MGRSWTRYTKERKYVYSILIGRKKLAAQRLERKPYGRGDRGRKGKDNRAREKELIAKNGEEERRIESGEGKTLKHSMGGGILSIYTFEKSSKTISVLLEMRSIPQSGATSNHEHKRAKRGKKNLDTTATADLTEAPTSRATGAILNEVHRKGDSQTSKYPKKKKRINRP